MKENKSTYSYLIEHMQNPSFQKVWDIAYDFVRKLPSDLCDELHESLNRGIDVLDSEPLLQMYFYSFGKMHNAKLQYVFEHLQKNVIEKKEIEIVDYGCGQGLATICYHDFLLEHNPEQNVKRIILIEPSSMALSRAELLCSRFFPNAEIVAINKQFDELTNDDLKLSLNIPTFHLFSNILDVESYDLSHFSKIVKEQSVGDNEYVMVSPMQNILRVQRLKAFATAIDKTIYFEQYLDKRQLDKDKDWTCVALICSNSIKQVLIEQDYDVLKKETSRLLDNEKEELYNEHCIDFFQKIQSYANQGDKRFQNLLGIWYENGIGTEQNSQLAFEWYKKSAEQGHDAAIYNLGICYSDGFGVEKNLENAYSLFLKSASLGFSDAKYQLFKCYLDGLGTPKDEKKAIKALKEAIKLKHPKSCFIMAKFCQSGKHVKEDERKALGLFKKAAELQYAPAQEVLGNVYRKGLLGEEESPKKSFKWYYKAAEQDRASAQFYIGYYYGSGYGVKKDANIAFEWYTRAAQHNNPSALNNLAICYEYGKGVEIDLPKAVYYYEKAAELGNITAQKNLANCYRNGTGVKPDTNKEFYWTLEAAKQFDLVSQQKIALYYFKGYGTNKSKEEALVWCARYKSTEDALEWYARDYLKAEYVNKIDNVDDAFRFFFEKAEKGDSQSLYLVGKCWQYGVGTEKNNEVANSYFEKAAELGHIESIIKTGKFLSLYKFCSTSEEANTFKDAYGVKYSKDRKVLISSGYQNVNEYIIPKGTRVICNGAFNGHFKKIVIPSSVLIIGANPFAEYGWSRCDVKEVECHSPNYIVSDHALYTRDEKKMISFFGRTSKFAIPQGVEVIGERAFWENEDLVEIEFSNSLHTIEDEAFMSCLKLKEISLPNSVTSIGRKCFYGCESLSRILSLGRVNIIKEGSFMGCSIQLLSLPETLIEIGNDAFNSNNELEHITLPNCTKRLGNSCFAFSSLKKVILNKELQEIGDFCFFKCPIDKITIPSQVKVIGVNPFVGVKSVECNGNDRYASENGLLYDKQDGTLISQYCESEIGVFQPISQIGSFAFYDSDVTDAFLGSNINKIAPWAFYKAKRIEKVSWRSSRITEIPIGCFGECSNMYKLDVPVTVKVVQKGALFDCFGLRKIRIENPTVIVNEEVFMRTDRPTDIPHSYWPRRHLMGSTIVESLGRRDLDFNSFTKIDVIVPKGCADKFHFSAIYDYDPFNSHSNYGYGMDRSFTVKEEGNE